ncbi:calcium-binding protein [Sagittula sp. SSi028]|uniref:calcium-binding protein n=1 Tax=Sagittula sp. SSi028 TaxID=3400636 RepID=UPI003AF5CA7A
MALPMFGSDEDDDQADEVSTSEGDLGEVAEGPPAVFISVGDASEAPDDYEPRDALPPLSDVTEGLTAITGVEIENREDLVRALEEMPTQYALVFGDEGDNAIFGTDQDDEVLPWTGDDRVFLGEGDDVYDPFLRNDAAGDDFVRGGNGNDSLSDSIGFDTLKGDAGDDVLRAVDEQGRTEADSLTGGVGNDILAGDAGDTLNGGEGQDVFFGLAEADADPIIVEDFDPDEDALGILIESDTPRVMSSFDVTVEEDEGNSLVRVDGELTAVLEGVTGLDPSMVMVGSYRW